MSIKIFNNEFFGIENANGDNCVRVIIDGGDMDTEYDNVKVYRFGDRGVDHDWTSPKRQESNANFSRPTDRQLNELALSQVRFGRKGALGKETPFVSVATNYKALYDNGEPWVQGILKRVNDLGVFAVPFGTVMRPSINSHATKSETEWLFYDGDFDLRAYLVEWRDNPYKYP